MTSPLSLTLAQTVTNCSGLLSRGLKHSGLNSLEKNQSSWWGTAEATSSMAECWLGGRWHCAISHAVTLHCSHGYDLPVPVLSPAYLRYKLGLKYCLLNMIILFI